MALLLGGCAPQGDPLQCRPRPEPAPAVVSDAQLIWDASGSSSWRLVLAGARVRLTLARHDDTTDGTLTTDDGRTAAVDHVTWDDAAGTLRLRLAGDGAWRWIDARSVDGVLVGRASFSRDGGDPPADATAFVDHVTGWNEQSFGDDIVPRTFFFTVGGVHARLRVDRDAGGVVTARYKQIATDSGRQLDEQIEVDGDVVRWDGHWLAVRFRDADGNEQALDGSVDGDELTATLTGAAGAPEPFVAQRGELLSAGFGPRDPAARADWQARTRRRLMHLFMADNPPPLSLVVERSPTLLPSTHGYATGRDDNPIQHPANYDVDEVRLVYALANPHGGAPLSRVIHGFVATPRAAAPPCGRPVVIALNGHDGSAASTFDRGSAYWYGDGWARRGYTVVAIDIGHRPVGDRGGLYDDYVEGDQPDEGNGVHPAIKAYGFDSDWEEEGERVWDVERAIDFAGTLADTDMSRVIVTGLSMGGEVTTWAAALDPRVTEAIPAGFVADQSVLVWRGNHWCWRWLHASVVDYVDTADLHALAAPRVLVVQSGVQDDFYSSLDPPFIDGKEVTRRSRAYFAEAPQHFLLYLHDDGHAYHFGDVLAANAKAPPLGLFQPLVIEPTRPGDSTWAADPWRAPLGRTLAQQVRAASRPPAPAPAEADTQRASAPAIDSSGTTPP